ncbi:MAG: EAL domain-containing protein [Sporomusaceae bacterium]|nr:EAL domain-containing protein [Sporomusaceae bacterium]
MKKNDSESVGKAQEKMLFAEIEAQIQKYQVLAEKTGDIILFIALEGQILAGNDAALRVYGYSAEELTALTIFDVREDGTEAALILEQMKLAGAAGVCFEAKHKRKNGTIFYVQVQSQRSIVAGVPVLLSIIRDISHRKQMEERLWHLAHYDYLTDIPNRYYLEEHLKKTGTNGCVAQKSALLLLDFDNFNLVNNSYGHKAGDRLLQQAVKLLKRNLRKGDFLARLGGDEFLIFLYETTLEKANCMATRLLKTLEKENFYVDASKIPLRVTASIGIVYIDEAVEVKRIFSYVDAAVHQAKEAGKNRVMLISDIDDRRRIFEMNRKVALIYQALRRDQFKLVFQPIYQSGKGIIHYEALIRLIDGDHIISPVDFIPVAEKSGLIASIDRWVISKTLSVLENQPQLRIFVNLSGFTLSDEGLLSWIERSILESGIEPNRLGFEITESATIKDLSIVEKWINGLKKLGCHFALDDFGVGFSSFSHLGKLPVDYLKIDGSFVRNLENNPKQQALVQAMNAVAHTLGKKTIAEFVENDAIWHILKKLEVDCGQGYYLGRPASLEEVLVSKQFCQSCC